MTEKHLYLAGGCFWGTQHYFKQVRGVLSTETGFANGDTEAPTYKEVYTDTTGYAEAVHIIYDADVVSLHLLLEMFFKAIDPTQVNGQAHDIGTRYRTGIYYEDAETEHLAKEICAKVAESYSEPIATEILPLRNFYAADEYHQDYLQKHPDGYCHLPSALFEYARRANGLDTE
ncbi:MAG: peptide-methionine (S)-S-oxide reductase MsrA [Alloprevotella sp.]|nr:peptide-methionine (S)-S-oxide reductase MsrA [Alloprevotella sp.]